jgi:transposase
LLRDGRPEAIQVADRWHLMENASAAFLTAVRRSMQTVRKAVGVNVVNPTVLTCAERRQHSGWLRREEENTAILALATQGMSIKEIVRQTGKSRGLVRPVVRGGRTDVFRNRLSSLDPFLKQPVAPSESCRIRGWTSRGHRMGDPTAERRSDGPAGRCEET